MAVNASIAQKRSASGLGTTDLQTRFVFTDRLFFRFRGCVEVFKLSYVLSGAKLEKFSRQIFSEWRDWLDVRVLETVPAMPLFSLAKVSAISQNVGRLSSPSHGGRAIDGPGGFEYLMRTLLVIALQIAGLVYLVAVLVWYLRDFIRNRPR
jgi:hypothetical protein